MISVVADRDIELPDYPDVALHSCSKLFMCELATEFFLFSVNNFKMSDLKSSSKFTTEELRKLDQFRARVGKIYPALNQQLIRWLRARDLDLDKAEEMLRR